MRILKAMAALSLALTLPLHAHAQSSDIVKIVVPYAAGTPIDISARVLARRLGELTGRTTIVENKPGAAGMIGTAEVARSPEGSVVLLMGLFNTLVIHPHLYAKPGYDPIKDFKPMVMLGSNGYLLVANPQTGIKNLKEFLDLARKNPGKIPYGTFGIGSGPHVCGAILESMTGVKLSPVPYKTAAILDVVGNQIGYSLEPAASAAPHVASGKLVALGWSTPDRPGILPGVPLIQDTVPGYECRTWNGVFAAKGVPDKTVEELSVHLRKIVKEDEYKERQYNVGETPWELTSKEFKDFVAKDLARWGEVIRRADMRAE